MKLSKKTIISEEEPKTEVTDNTSKKKKKRKLPKMRLQTKIIIVLAIALAIAIATLTILNGTFKDKLTITSESSLQEVLEINELSTVDYIYNATATKYTKDNNPMYYVAYEGTVTAGIDFSKITIDVAEESKKIVFTIPPVEIHSVKVDMGKMDYIFVKNKYETETISEEAYKLCKEDLKTRVESENVLFDTAKENAIYSVEALFKPWLDTAYEGYTVEFK